MRSDFCAVGALVALFPVLALGCSAVNQPTGGAPLDASASVDGARTDGGERDASLDGPNVPSDAAVRPDASGHSDAGGGSLADAGSDGAGAPDAGGDGATVGDSGLDATAPPAPDGGSPLGRCVGGKSLAASDAGSATATGYGFIDIASPDNNPITSLVTTLVVPKAPAATGTLFLWPGLQPASGGANFNPINNGVLQPVLTWGPTCAPHAPASAYASWWVSAQYVNTIGKDPGFTGCQGGDGMAVATGDSLVMSMTLAGTTWTQTVTDAQSGASVSFAFDLQGQSQNYAEFMIEGYSSAPTVPVEFENTVITFTSPSPSSCEPTRRGLTDDYSAPQASTDGLACCIASMRLRPQGL